MKKTIVYILLIVIAFSSIDTYFGLKTVASDIAENNYEPVFFNTDIEDVDTPNTDIPDPSEPPVVYIPVDDIDIADVRSPMTVGTSQVLGVTIIPANATERTITYRSLTPRVASVNALGRVTSIAPGTATIEVSAGWVTRIVSIVVEPKEVEEDVRVSSIDVDFENTMTVGTTQTIFHSVLPREANSQVEYSSDNIRVATVNDFGRVNALSVGRATITLTVDDVTKPIVITVTNEIEATEIDLGDVQIDMTIGTSQTINVRIFPFDAIEQTIEYTSSNNTVLTVNSFGRVNAAGVGRADITVSVGSLRKTVTIDVKEKIVPTDIDFDESETTININSSINLWATVLPSDADDRTIIYTSSDTSVITVNELGRVRGIDLGTATITLQAGDIVKSVVFTVVEEDVVTSIDVRDFKDEMKVDDTQAISLSLHPTNAGKQTVRYASSNTSVAIVSEGGVITAIGRGISIITITSGVAVKELELSVYIATEKIAIPDNFLIMQPTDSYRIVASVSPISADQNLTYQSTNESVVEVSTNGIITALSTGRASVIVSNFDFTVVISVVVNEGSGLSYNDEIAVQTTSHIQNRTLASRILEFLGAETISINGAEHPVITTDALHALFGTAKSISIFFDDYVIRIRGIDIRNAENVLYTDISLVRTDIGISFTVNEDANLPGTIEIEFLDLGFDYRHLFLINNSTDKLERLNSLNGTTATISLSGKYILSTSDINSVSFEMYAIIAFSVLLCICIAIYIYIRKKHWFW